MSEENVEIVRRAYAAFTDGDFGRAFEAFDPQLEVEDHEKGLDTPRSYAGTQGILEMVANVAEPFDDHRLEPQEFVEGKGCVLVTIRRRGKGRGSGIDVDENQWHVLDFSGKRIVRLRVFVSQPQALEAAGLSE